MWQTHAACSASCGACPDGPRSPGLAQACRTLLKPPAMGTLFPSPQRLPCSLPDRVVFGTEWDPAPALLIPSAGVCLCPIERLWILDMHANGTLRRNHSCHVLVTSLPHASPRMAERRSLRRALVLFQVLVADTASRTVAEDTTELLLVIAGPRQLASRSAVEATRRSQMSRSCR